MLYCECHPNYYQRMFSIGLFNFSHYIEEKIGTKYVEKKTIPFDVSYEESGPSTPVFFVLSPGVDPLKDVEALGKKLGFTLDNRNLHNVSLGQASTLVYIYCIMHIPIVM